MYLPSVSLATRALLAGLIGSGDNSLAARDDAWSYASFQDPGDGNCWLYLNKIYGCTGWSNDPIGTWGNDDPHSSRICVGSGVVPSDICDTASISVDFDAQSITFSNPMQTQFDIWSWDEDVPNNQTVNIKVLL